MKLSQEDKLLLLEGRLKEAIAASKKVRAGNYQLRERPEKIGKLLRGVQAALKIAEGL